MKRTYSCPHCGATLNPNVKIVLTAVKDDARALVLLSPEPGNYKAIIPDELTLELGELVQLLCPVCSADLSVNGKFALIHFGFSTGTRGAVRFSRRYGEHATYFVAGDQIDAYGEDAEAETGTNFFGVGRG